MATGTWILIGTVLVLVFWSVGAYNRLSHHRDRLVRRQAEAERVLRLRRRAVAAWATAAGDGDEAGDDAPPVAAVLHACAQADAAGDGVRASPTSRSAVAALNLAEQVLESTLRGFMRHPRAATAGAGGRRAAWVSAEVQLVVARQVLNREVAVYNAAVGQFPASVIAAAAGLHATGTLEAGTELSPAGGAPTRAAVGATIGTAAGAALAAAGDDRGSGAAPVTGEPAAPVDDRAGGAALVAVTPVASSPSATDRAGMDDAPALGRVPVPAPTASRPAAGPDATFSAAAAAESAAVIPSSDDAADIPAAAIARSPADVDAPIRAAGGVSAADDPAPPGAPA